MKSWTYFISIPIAIIITILFWVNLNKTINDGTFDSLPAWIISGIICHSSLIALSIHCYKTNFGSWIKRERKS